MFAPPVRETAGHVAQESAALTRPALGAIRTDTGVHNTELSGHKVLAQATSHNRSICGGSTAGLVNDDNDDMVWGLFPIFFALTGLSVGNVGLLVVIAPAVGGSGSCSAVRCPTGWGAGS